MRSAEDSRWRCDRGSGGGQAVRSVAVDAPLGSCAVRSRGNGTSGIITLDFDEFLNSGSDGVRNTRDIFIHRFLARSATIWKLNRRDRKISSSYIFSRACFDVPEQKATHLITVSNCMARRQPQNGRDRRLNKIRSRIWRDKSLSTENSRRNSA
jgi:hypothetical protein